MTLMLMCIFAVVALAGAVQPAVAQEQSSEAVVTTDPPPTADGSDANSSTDRCAELRAKLGNSSPFVEASCANSAIRSKLKDILPETVVEQDLSESLKNLTAPSEIFGN